MYLAVIILPLLGSIVSGFYGRKVGVTGAQVLTSFCIITTTILAILIFSEVAFNNVSVTASLFRWLDLESIDLSWEFNFDFLTVSMLIPVLIISSLVHIYSIGYMSGDPHNQRFFSYLSLFTFMMVILVTGNNFLLMFVGWEGVGICSYLLVNFWYTRIAANQSSISAFLTNRVGDCLLTIGMFIILLTFGNLDYTTVFSLAPYINQNIITVIGICLLIGAMAKSSQIGLHVWLPLAMEGPTPVSALIHAATMVTAGVYLLMRASPLIEYSSTVLLTCLWIGSVTTVFSSIIGLFQQDIKKVIAYSTMSQLGMMVIAIGLSCYNIALFHLVNHAFYKGLLFLGAGAVIHAVSDNQDFRKYGGLILFLPLTYAVMLIASLSLVAFPFMTGFYSKDFILESCFAQYNYSGIAVYFTALLGAVFTTLYSIKVLYITFIANPNGSAINYNKTHESDVYMSIPLVILAVFSIYFGFITKDIFIGLASHAFTDNSLFIHPVNEISICSEFGISNFFKLLPFYLTVIISIFFILVLELTPGLILKLKYTRIGYNVFAYFNLKFLVESIYNRFVTYSILNLGGKTTKLLDKGVVEMLGPNGLERLLTFLSRNLNTLNTGVVTTYALYILMGFILYVSLPYLLKDSATLFIVMFSALTLYMYTNKNIGKIISDEYKLTHINRNDIVKCDLTTINADNASLAYSVVYATVVGTLMLFSVYLVYIRRTTHKDRDTIFDIKNNVRDNALCFNGRGENSARIYDSYKNRIEELVPAIKANVPVKIFNGFEHTNANDTYTYLRIIRHPAAHLGDGLRPKGTAPWNPAVDLFTHQIIDQHNHTWLSFKSVPLFWSNTYSTIQFAIREQIHPRARISAWPGFPDNWSDMAASMNHTPFIKTMATDTYYIKNFTPLRDFSTSDTGTSGIAGYFEINGGIVTHIYKAADLTVEYLSMLLAITSV